VIAGYRLEEQIGRGGMAVVYRASDELLGRQVALKILAPALGADNAFRRRFVQESRAAALVDDPHIIPIFQAGESGDLLFIAMRLVSGGDVRGLVRLHGSLPAARAAAIVSHVASALDAAHAAGLVHRDVKPANMLLDARPGRPDHVYLSDFGLSKGLLSPPGLTGEGVFVGTPHYIAPEQVTGSLVDGRADQYSLACSAFELLSGAPPFQGGNAMAVIHAQAFDQAPSLTSLRSSLPSAVDLVLSRALAKAPAERYPTCQDFAEALRAALGLAPYADGPAAPPGQDPSGPAARPPAADRDPARNDTERRGARDTGIAGGHAARPPAARRHRKRQWRLFTLAGVASLLAIAGVIAPLARHADGRQAAHPRKHDAAGLIPVPGSLQGVTAQSATSTWALADDCATGCPPVPQAPPPLLAHWDGTSWSKIISPVASARLMAVAAGAAHIIWTAGYSCVAGCGGSSEVDKTLILRWDGHSLSPIPTPSPGRSARLSSVTAGPAGTAYAAGYYCVSDCGGSSELDHALLLSWNRGRWSRLQAESPGLSARLTGVSAGQAGVPWAVGYYCESGCATLSEVDHPLALRPRGTRWSSVPSPSPDGHAQLLGVSAGPGGTAWAVGYDTAGTGTLVIRWDTRRWHIVASPSPGHRAQLLSVSASPGGTAWAAGTYCASGCDTIVGQVDRTLIMQLGTHGWHIVPSPKSGQLGRLTSISSGPDGTAWAAGYYCTFSCGGPPSRSDRTLVLRWQHTRWIPG
jgi:serine/threonine-protein kinase